MIKKSTVLYLTEVRIKSSTHQPNERLKQNTMNYNTKKTKTNTQLENKWNEKRKWKERGVKSQVWAAVMKRRRRLLNILLSEWVEDQSWTRSSWIHRWLRLMLLLLVSRFQKVLETENETLQLLQHHSKWGGREKLWDVSYSPAGHKTYLHVIYYHDYPYVQLERCAV